MSLCKNQLCNKCYAKPRCAKVCKKPAAPSAAGQFEVNNGVESGTANLEVPLQGSAAAGGFDVAILGSSVSPAIQETGTGEPAVDLAGFANVRSQAKSQKLLHLEGSVRLESDTAENGEVQIVLMEKQEDGPNAGLFKLRSDRILYSHSAAFVLSTPVDVNISKSLTGITLRKGKQYAFGVRYIGAGIMTFSASLSISYHH